MAKQQTKQELTKENKTMDNILEKRMEEIKVLKNKVTRLENEKEDLDYNLKLVRVANSRLNGNVFGLERAIELMTKNKG